MLYYIIHIFKATLHPPRFRETQCLLSVVCCPLSAVCCPLSVVLPSAICCLLSAVWGDIHRDPYHEKRSISPPSLSQPGLEHSSLSTVLHDGALLSAVPTPVANHHGGEPTPVANASSLPAEAWGLDSAARGWEVEVECGDSLLHAPSRSSPHRRARRGPRHRAGPGVVHGPSARCALWPGVHRCAGSSSKQMV